MRYHDPIKAMFEQEGEEQDERYMERLAPVWLMPVQKDINGVRPNKSQGEAR